MVKRVPFDRAIQDVTGGNLRLQTSDYLLNGTIPIIDQGQALVAGYTENESAICRRQGAVILFGDHTRTFKYVDFDFALGADGVKVLQCRDGFDARYLFHYLRTIQLPENLGYSRHFKFLKECEVPKPELAEQQRIAAILDKAESLRSKRQEVIRLADDLLRSTLLTCLEQPCNALVVEQLLSAKKNAIRTGPFGSQLLHAEFTESGVPVLGIDNVVTNRFRWDERRYISAEKYEQLSRYTVYPGDVMVTIMGTTGRVAVAPDDLPICISTKHLCTMTVDRTKILPEFLWACLLWDPAVRAQSSRESKGAIMDGLNMGIVKGLLIKVPSMDVQQRFVSVMRKVDALRSKYKVAIDDGASLNAALTSKLLAGSS